MRYLPRATILMTFRELLQPCTLQLTALAFCVAAQAADVLSSLGLKSSGGVEDNPFARYSDGSFNVLHAVGLKVWFVSESALFSWMVWIAARNLPEKYRATASSLPLFYLAWIGIDAAFGNGLYHLGWYQALPTNSTLRLILP